jgi:hypothetical protein
MARRRGVTREQVADAAMRFPGVAQYPPGAAERLDLRLGKKHLVFESTREQGALCLRPVYEDEQRFLMETQPEAYFLTDHYRGWNCILIRQAMVDRAELEELIETAWRRIALKRDIKEYDARVAAAPLGGAGGSRSKK